MLPPMQIAAQHHVTVKYAVALEGEPAPDSVENGQVAEFIHGRGQILPGLENRLSGLAAGQRITIDLPPAEAFGERDPALDIRVSKTDFPEDVRDRLTPGMRFRGAHPSNPDQAALFTVTAVEGDALTASGNHPLAGKTLRCDVQVLAVREATDDELNAGGCCGGGGCGSGSCGEGGCGDGSCGSHEHGHEHGGSGGGCGSGGCGCH
jgi:FKBP-type peptidyl-prolyl cis-trans isomerase SlyD